MTLYSVEQQQFGLKKESSRGTAESSPGKWFPTRGNAKVSYDLKHLKDEGIRGIAQDYAPVAGPKEGMAKIPLNLDPHSCVDFFYSLLGGVSSAEATPIVISSSNQKLDFNIGASELTATVTTGSYAIGATSADSGSLCKAIKDALFAADATGTYTVSYSRTTKLFTVARSTGTFQLLAATGSHIANGIFSTIGFAATDRTAAITYTGTVQIEYAFAHTLTQSTDISKIAYTLFLDRSLNVMKYNGAVVKKIGLKGGADNLVDMDVEMLCRTEASGSIGSPSYPTQRYLGFADTSIYIASAQNTKVVDWALNIDNGAKGLRTFANSQDISDVVVADRIAVDGSFTVLFEDTTERAKFLANTSSALEFLLQGTAIGGTVKYGVDINIYKAVYESFPYEEEKNLLAAKATFKGFYDSSAAKTLQIAVTNQDVSY
jgi:hypothetical protein